MSERAGRPAVAVVIATRQRADRWPALVAALRAQSLADFEVVVVDDASTDETGAAVAAAAAGDLRFSVVRQAVRAGPAAARNVGWRRTVAPRVAFTDDDCLPAPDWLERLVVALADADIAQGRTVPDPSGEWHLHPWAHSVEVDREGGYYETCNIAYRRAALESVGGFDEAFGPSGQAPAFGEDTDLAWRAIGDGATTTFVAGALVHHEVRLASWLDRLRASGRRAGIVALVHRHPGVRATFPSRWFYRPSHLPALAAALGWVVAGSRRTGPAAVAAAAATLPWCWVRTHTEPVRGRRRTLPLVLPLQLVADLADVTVLASASVRERTLVL